MPERAPPLRDEPPEDYEPQSSEQLMEWARRSFSQEQAGRRSTAIHKAQKLWVARPEPFIFSGLAVPPPSRNAVVADELLNTLVSCLRRHSRLDDAGASIVALWIAHCWCIEWVKTSPRLAVGAAASGAGKSMLLRLISALVPRPLLLARTAAAPLLYLIDAAHPTIVLDDADQWVFNDRALRDVLVTGYARDARHLNRAYGIYEPLAHSTFTPCAIAFAGELPPGLARRSIAVFLSPPAKGETPRPEMQSFEDDFQSLRAQLARWAHDAGERVTTHQAVLLDGLPPAQASLWRPLLAIAAAAANDWVARAAAAALGSAKEAERDIGLELLSDVRAVLESADRVTSVDLLAALLKSEERPWRLMPNGRKLDVRSLARMLAPYGVRPRVMRSEKDTFARGYHAADFAAAFARYLEPAPADQLCVNALTVA